VLLACAAAIVLGLGAGPARAAEYVDYHWIGAGTGGNTATDPADPSTQWDNPANWQEGAVPGPDQSAHLPLTGPGYVNAQSGTVRGLSVDGTSLEGALCIAAGADLATVAGITVGPYAVGRVVQRGGSMTVGGHLLLGYGASGVGEYVMDGGTLTVLSAQSDALAIGYLGTGTFTLKGGTTDVAGDVTVGTAAPYSSGVLNLEGGTLRAGSLILAGGDARGTLNITSAEARIEVGYLWLGPGSALTAPPGAEVHVHFDGYPLFDVRSKDERALAGLENVSLIFEGSDPLRGAGLEVAGRDRGPTRAGFAENFVLGRLVVGASAPALLGLVDNNDNGNRLPAEAVYVHDLSIGPGSTLDLRGFHLYYDGVYDNQGSVVGGAPMFVPEPATLLLLALGAAIVRARRCAASRATM